MPPPSSCPSHMSHCVEAAAASATSMSLEGALLVRDQSSLLQLIEVLLVLTRFIVHISHLSIILPIHIQQVGFNCDNFPPLRATREIMAHNFFSMYFYFTVYYIVRL